VRDLATGGRHIVDLLCLLLVEEAEDIIRVGVLSDYLTREEELSTLRGRLLVERQINQQYGQVGRLECRHDEWEADIVENRLVSAGLAAARRLCGDAGIRARVVRTAAAFADVCQPDATEDIVASGRRIEYHRRNAHYRGAHQWALLLLANSAVENLYAPGESGCFAFLLDMNLLFEQFVARLLTEACAGTQVRVEAQASSRSIIVEPSGRSYTSVRPDLLVRDRTTLPAVTHALDTKYKLYDDRRIDTADIYQSFLYAYAFGEPNAPEFRIATLVYPSTTTHESRRLLVQSQAGLRGATVRAVGLALADIVDDIAAERPPAPALFDLLLSRGKEDPTPIHSPAELSQPNAVA
jgi:5-methylcytosine-specific restriction enzyme subunit McrC